MDALLLFFKDYGLVVTIIAVCGIILLGILKYCNLFSKIAEDKRHYIYLTITISLSVIAAVIYMAIVKQLTAKNVFTASAAICALNQTFYNIFKVTPIKDLFKNIIDYFVGLSKNKLGKTENNDTSENKDK